MRRHTLSPGPLTRKCEANGSAKRNFRETNNAEKALIECVPINYPSSGYVNAMNRMKLLFLVARAAHFEEILAFVRSAGCESRVRSILVGASAVVDAVDEWPDVILLEQAGESSGNVAEMVRDVRRANRAAPVVFISNQAGENAAAEALEAGAQEHFSLPLSPSIFLSRIQACLAKSSSRPMSLESESRSYSGQIIGTTGLMREMQRYLEKAAKKNCTVLVTGETGTGKELVAEFIHANSPRRDSPFVCINCAAIPDTLLESELFGHTRGAFTGAQEQREGLLSSAAGGTVFLDEIGDMSSFAQAKILRVLETRQVCRLGATRQMNLDVRFIAATNQDLHALAAQKAFRHDLLYRLDVVHVHLPPLRDRKEDIPVLAREFGKRFSPESPDRPIEFTEDCLRVLLQHDWPGNIRELKNVIEGLLVFDPPNRIGPEHLPARLRAYLSQTSKAPHNEKETLLSALLSTKWNMTKAAEKLQWSRMTLYRKIAKYHIRRASAQGVTPM